MISSFPRFPHKKGLKRLYNIFLIKTIITNKNINFKNFFISAFHFFELKQEIKILASTVPIFKAGKAFKEAVNK